MLCTAAPSGSEMGRVGLGTPGRWALLEAIVREVERATPKARAVEIIGSYASHEQHLRVRGLGTVSYSDVDLVYHGEACGGDRARIVNGVRRVLSTAGLCSVSVSLKSAADIARLPHGREWLHDQVVPTDLPEKARFVRFWTAISAFEYGLRCLGPADDVAERASYGVVKVFFTLVRNLALLSGTSARSYAAICSWALRVDAGAPASTAYRVKLGTVGQLHYAVAAALLGRSAVARFLRRTGMKPEEQVMDIAESVLRAYRSCAQADPVRFLQFAEDAAYADYVKHVLEYEHAKLRARFRQAPRSWGTQ